MASLHVQRFHEKRPLVADLFDDLCGGLARTVAGPGFDADEGGGIGGLGILQLGGKLETVAGDDAVVGVGGGDEGGGVAGAGLEVVIGGIGAEGFEFFGVVGGAVVVDPGPADGELVEAEHVHDAHGGEAGPIEFGALGHAGADEQAAIAAALDGEFLGAGVVIRDEPFGGGDEVIKNILFV